MILKIKLNKLENEVILDSLFLKISFLIQNHGVMCIDDAENNTSKSHGPRTLLMAPAQQEETILVEGTGVVPAKCSPKIKSELFSLL